VVLLAVRWYLRFGLAHRDLKEILANENRVDHVSVYRWVQRFRTTAGRPGPGSVGTAVGDRWFVDETYVKVAGVWRDVVPCR